MSNIFDMFEDKFDESFFGKTKPKKNEKITIDFEVSQIVMLNGKNYFVKEFYHQGAISVLVLQNTQNSEDIIQMKTA